MTLHLRQLSEQDRLALPGLFVQSQRFQAIKQLLAENRDKLECILEKQREIAKVYAGTVRDKELELRFAEEQDRFRALNYEQRLLLNEFNLYFLDLKF